jgi:arginase
LLYVDRHYDINTPESTTDGALDWMGLAHAVDLPGCLDILAGAFGSRPLLEADQVVWLGVEPPMATPWEREQADRRGLKITTSQALAADPAGTAAAALRQLPPWPLAVHIDVDVLDFTDAPLAENTDGRNRDLRSTRPPRRSRWRPGTSGCERCRSENSTRPAAPGILTRFPALSAALPAYSQPRLTDHRAATAMTGLEPGAISLI